MTANAASDYLENKILDHITGKATFSPPTAYLALGTAGSDSSFTEVSYTGYARKATAAADWEASSGGHTQNATVLSFAACTAGSATASHFAIYDAISTGNMLVWGALDANLAISAGITPEFAIGALDLYCD